MVEKNFEQAEMFANRLSKRYKHLRKWARREAVSCYRLYDRDIPEIPLAVDIFEFSEDAAASRFAVLFLYESRYKEISLEWLALMQNTTAKILCLAENQVVIKMRKHDKGGGQYAAVSAKTEGVAASKKIAGFVTECGLKFYVDLTSYIDCGLFFDHRPLRKIVRKMAAGKRVLNLFCYTASFSVYAASGGAALVESVDLSNTYLSWAQKNMLKNGFADSKKYTYTKADVAQFLRREQKCFDIIVLDPPTFSNSKMARTTLDINRDWTGLVRATLKLLSPDGTLFFSTNSRKLKFDAALLPNVAVKDITDKTIDEDFKKHQPHRAWELKLLSRI